MKASPSSDAHIRVPSAGDPYRTLAIGPGPGPVVKFPRLVFEQGDRRLIQCSEESFVIETRTTHTDALGTVTYNWVQGFKLEAPKPLSAREMASYSEHLNAEIFAAAYWLAKRIAEGPS
jgi:hypothetical protein